MRQDQDWPIILSCSGPPKDSKGSKGICFVCPFHDRNEPRSTLSVLSVRWCVLSGGRTGSATNEFREHNLPASSFSAEDRHLAAVAQYNLDVVLNDLGGRGPAASWQFLHSLFSSCPGMFASTPRKGLHVAHMVRLPSADSRRHLPDRTGLRVVMRQGLTRRRPVWVGEAGITCPVRRVQ
jgi:hypothetical protein